jgi:hypothetical protein
MPKLSGLPANTTPALVDLFTMIQSAGPTDVKVTLANLITFLGSNTYNPYKFTYYASSATTIAASNVPTKVAFQTKVFDTSSNFDNATTYRFVAPIAGFYWFSAVTTVFVINTTACQCSIYKNGTALKSGSYFQNLTGSNSNMLCQASGLIQLAAADYVEVFQADNQASTSNIITGLSNSWFEGFFVSAT